MERGASGATVHRVAKSGTRLKQLSMHSNQGFPDGLQGKVSARSAGDPGGSIPGSGRSPGERNGNPLQYSCLGNPMDRGA